MLMAIKIKEVNVFPVLQILVKPLDEEAEAKYLRNPDQYYYHLGLMLTRNRMGRSILQEFIDRDLTGEGITWLAGELVKKDRQFTKDCEYVMGLHHKQDPNPGRI